jgi:hypothetical protein
LNPSLERPRQIAKANFGNLQALDLWTNALHYYFSYKKDAKGKHTVNML